MIIHPDLRNRTLLINLQSCTGIYSLESSFYGSQPVIILDQSHATASSEEQNNINNTPEKISQQDGSEFQYSMASNLDESPLEMQYSIHHVPLMLHGSASLAGQLGPIPPTDVYGESAR
jgi:hypothetical protein